MNVAALTLKKPSPAFIRFREAHHAIARYFAMGMTVSAVSAKTGFTRRRLHLMLADPSFQNLIMEYYQRVEDRVAASQDDFAEMSIGDMFMAERMVQQRLNDADEAGEPLPMRELLAIIKDRADRFGYGPKSTRVNINADFAIALDRAIERSGKVIEAQADGRPLPAPHDPTPRPGPRRSVGSAKPPG